MTPGEFIQQIAPAAVKLALKYDVPASLLIAQALKESRYGTSGLAIKAKNLGGMKATGKAIPGIWDGKSALFKTGEYTKDGQKIKVTAPFRVYDSWEQSLEDIAHRHAVRFGYTLKKYGGDVVDYITNLLSKTGYATDPRYLPSILNDYIAKYNLQKFDKVTSIETPKTNGAKKKLVAKKPGMGHSHVDHSSIRTTLRLSGKDFPLDINVEVNGKTKKLIEALTEFSK